MSDDSQNLETSDAHADRPSQLDTLELRRSKQLEFFLTVLQSISKSNSNPDIVYPLLRQHLDLLDIGLIEVLRTWVNVKFAEVDRDSQKLIAACLVNFGDFIQQFPLGNKSVNMECSIDCYNAALNVYSKEDFPIYWGKTQNSLAIAYSYRIEEDRADNLEKSIECNHFALEIYTKEELPIEWAIIQNNLAIVYVERIRGDRAENLERAIECCLAALEFRTKTNLPFQWADSQNNLGVAYSNRIRGDRAENLERAIEYYLAALEFRTKTNLPVDWAMTQSNLAAVYSMRICGDRAENLERAIECYLATLEVRIKTNLPIDWAITQNNLAAAYNIRIKGDRSENLERAIEFCHAALEIRNKTNLPIDWAATQSNMAIAYSERMRGNRADNLENSINCSRAALEIYTAESFPSEWAKIQIDLARISIEKLQDYQIATEHLQSAYEHLLANNNDTGLLAQTMFELARCFHKTGCLGQAKIYFKDSIRLFQRLEQPTQVAAVTSALGNLELQMGAIDDARIHLQTALEFYQAAGNLERVASIQDLQQCLPEHSAEPAI